MPHAVQRSDATVAEAANALNCTERTIYRKITDGDLPARRVGKRYFIAWDDLGVNPPDPIREAAIRVVSEAPRLSADQLQAICNLLRGAA